MSSPRYLEHTKAEKNKRRALNHAHNGHGITAASLSHHGNKGHSGEVKKHFKEKPPQSPHKVHKPTPLRFSEGGTRRRRGSRSRSRKYYRR